MNAKILKHGSIVRLFPVFPESKKEQRTLSIVLATLTSVRPFAKEFFSDFGVRIGSRSRISCFTEVTLTNEVKGIKDRPDALLIVETGKSSWSALIEAKVGRQKVESDQLDRYIELANVNGVDAVITVSNDLTPAPEVNPTQPSRALPKRLSLYHVSWSSILTKAFLLAANDDKVFENDDELFLISELIRYLEHDGSGREPLTQMNKEWPKIVSDVVAGHPLNPGAVDLTEMIAIWHQEARDIALIMTRRLGYPVSIAKVKSNAKDPANWIATQVKHFCDQKTLDFELDIPNAASRVKVEADFRRRIIKCAMRLQAPTDRKSNSARLNWLLRQLRDGDMSKVIVTCITHGRGHNFGARANEIDPNSDEIKALAEIVSFQVEMSADLGKYFNSRKRFVEILERHIPEFYENVGERLKAFVPPPPKIKPDHKADNSDKEFDVKDDQVATDTDLAQPASLVTKPESHSQRPPWAIHWQTSEPTDG